MDLQRIRSILAAAALAIGLAAPGAGWADPGPPAAAALLAKYQALAGQLRNNPFQRPIHLDSSENAGELTGDIYALVDAPYAQARAVLDEPAEWCEVLMLHLNTKHCRATDGDGDGALTVRVGKKHQQPVDEAYRLEFSYHVEAAAPDYLSILLKAAEGPLNTRDYRIRLQAIPLADGRTFLRLTYSCTYGLISRMAMKTYLATLARDKVGFTVIGRDSDGGPDYIGGMRGVVERNTMRYYLAIDAYLDSLSVPPAQRTEKRLQAWFTATEQYARQLHELDRGDYLQMKRAEYLRLKGGR